MRAVYAVLSVLSALAAVVADVVQPLLPFASLVAVVLGVLFVLILSSEKIGLVRVVVLKLTPDWLTDAWNEHLGPEHVPDIRNMVLVAAALFSGGAALSQASASEGGYVQKVIPALEPLAAKMEQVAIDLKGVNEVVVENNQRLARIEHGLQGVARETSDDPQKELANLGLDFHPMMFFKNIENERIYDLYMKAGISIDPSEWHYFFMDKGAMSDQKLSRMAAFFESQKFECPIPLDSYSEKAAQQADLFFTVVTNGYRYSPDSNRRKLADIICNSEDLGEYVQSYETKASAEDSFYAGRLKELWATYNGL